MGSRGPAPAPGLRGGGGAPEVLIAGRARGRELLGNRPTLPSASPGPPAGAAPAPAAAAAATAPSSVGGTLVRHEVTAAHTRSLFCSLQLFFSPLALIVAIPIVHKSSRSVAAQQESLSLFPFPLLVESRHPNAPLAGVETCLVLMAAALKS